MKNSLIAIALLIITGCAAYVTPSGTYIEPLPETVVIGPPEVVAAPPDIIVQPLPSVVVVPGRDLYSYQGYYYYHWDAGWYWSRQRRGPWHVLPRDRWPSHMERREGEHERHERDRDRY